MYTRKLIHIVSGENTGFTFDLKILSLKYSKSATFEYTKIKVGYIAPNTFTVTLVNGYIGEGL